MTNGCRIPVKAVRVVTAWCVVSGVVLLLGGWSSKHSQSSARITLGKAEPGSLYGVTVAVKDPAQLQTESVEVAIADGGGVLAAKRLHSQDLDFYVTLRARSAGPITVALQARSGQKLPEITTAFHRIPTGKAGAGVIAAMPNDAWQNAQPFEFGQTIYGASDERPYSPAPDEDRYAALVKGFQWFRFTFHGDKQTLAYFVLDITDREVPLDVDIFTLENNSGGSAIKSYTNGASIYQIEATQNYPGLYRFRTRILQPGQTYYVRVAADHPSYQLRTFSYPVPPYSNPQQAVRTGMDFLVNMGDSWLSNTPRRARSLCEPR